MFLHSVPKVLESSKLTRHAHHQSNVSVEVTDDTVLVEGRGSRCRLPRQRRWGLGTDCGCAPPILQGDVWTEPGSPWLPGQNPLHEVRPGACGPHRK